MTFPPYINKEWIIKKQNTKNTPQTISPRFMSIPHWIKSHAQDEHQKYSLFPPKWPNEFGAAPLRQCQGRLPGPHLHPPPSAWIITTPLPQLHAWPPHCPCWIRKIVTLLCFSGRHMGPPAPARDGDTYSEQSAVRTVGKIKKVFFSSSFV